MKASLSGGRRALRMKPSAVIRLSIIALAVSAGTSNAQSLADVLSSIQERKRALQQSQQVAAHLPSVAGSSVTIPAQQLIAWTGLAGVDFPTDQNLAATGIEQRVALVNQAIVEFRKLSPWYVNLRPGDLSNAAMIGAIRPYLREDFPELGRADASNYHALLFELARDVMRLRVLPWPFAGKRQGKEFVLSKWEEAVESEENPGTFTIIVKYPEGAEPFDGWEPATLGEGTIPAGDPGSWEFARAENSFGAAGWLASLKEAVTLTAGHSTTYHEYGDYSLNSMVASKTTASHSDAAIFSKVPGRTGDQLGGKVALLCRNSWSPAASGDVSAPASWGTGDASYRVVAVAVDAMEPTALADDSQITLSLAWFDGASSGLRHGLPSGFTALKARLQGGSYGDWAGSYQSSLGENPVRVLGRTLHALCAPGFTKGLDATGKPARLAQSEGLLRPPSGDAAPVLNPVPGLLAGVPLGVGLDGASLGWIGVSPGEWWFHTNDSPQSNSASGILYPTGFTGPMGIRFDYASNLRFCGPAQDFHVVYATSRDGTVRGAPLPDAKPTSQEAWNSGMGNLMDAWDLPRLRQVVSRDLVAVITPQGHYQNTVKIYRRPQSAGPVDRTPGHFEQPDEQNLVRTLVFSNPSAGNDPYPATGEMVRITDGSTTHSVSQGSAGSFGWPNTLWFKTTVGTKEFFSRSIGFDWDGGYIKTTTTAIDGLTVAVDESVSDDWNWWSYQSPDSATRTAAGLTTTLANTFDTSSPGSQEGRYPATTDIDFPDRPDVAITWKSGGVLHSVTQGRWSANCTTDNDGALKVETLIDGSLVGTVWSVWSDGGRTVRTYATPDGSVTGRTDSRTDWSETEYGDSSSTGLPGLPHKITRSDGTGTTFAWTIGNDGAGTLVAADGLMSGGAVTKGRQQTTLWNSRGFTTSTSTNLLLGGTVKAAGAAVPEGESTGWGMPTKWKDDFTDLSTTIAYDNNLSRIASVTSPLGLATGFSAFDALGRPGQVTANGITATNTFAGLGATTTYTGTDIQEGTQSSTARDALGRLLSSGTTWNGVVDNLGLAYGAGTVGVTRTAGPCGTHTARIRQADGTLASASGPTLPFGGLGGNGLSASNGLLVARAEILDGQGQGTGAFAETHTDAWGRVREVVTPSASGAGSATTGVAYSNPDSPLRRVTTTGPSGRVSIAESNPFDASGAVSRSGIDVDGNGSLGAADRYTESVTTVDGTKVVTTLKVTEEAGLREILRTEWTPSTGVTVTKVNGNEETITTAPDYGNKSVTATSSKGWTRTTALNSLGLPTGDTLSGTGIPTTGLDPVWRADGTLASVGLRITTGPNNQNETHTAAFNPDGTLAGLTVPGKGNILEGHTIANGVETLTIDGVTRTARLDGTQAATSGAGTVGKTETLAVSGGGFKHTVTPGAGGATGTILSAAFSPASKTYADDSGEAYGYEDELLASVSLARGGSVALGYSGDGAKDLVSIAWPAVSSGPFSIPAFTHGFGYDRAGRVESLADSSGARTFGYWNGRQATELWTAGPLKGYELIRHLDATGRGTGFTLKRDGAVIHAVEKAPNGDGDRIANLASGKLTATPQRDAAGRVTGYVRSDGTNTVTQTWRRGAGGRIEYAGSDVPGAPSFGYLAGPGESFDSRGRRLKCATAGGAWAYQYGTAGQLVSAVHPTLGSFAYAFDGIGRRTDKGAANTTDLLNRTLAWTHSQNKTVKVTANPGARLWFNGVEVQDFNGSHTAAVAPPGPEGGWVGWSALAVLEGQGEGAGDPPANALASPDAKAEKHGAVWVPPASETFGYDAAGNRQGNARWDYGWDAGNQLARARTKDFATAPQGWDIRFSYDAAGRRVRKHVIGLRGGERAAETIITFVWDGWDLIYERHQLPGGLTTLERRYLWGPDIADGAAGGAGGLLLVRETKGSATRDIHPLYDGTGHVVALTNAGKELLAAYAYGPFGEAVHATGPAAQSNPWRWATKYLDEETGLYYFGLRYYDPVTGQWLSREPLGEGESVNLYSYCHNDPVNRVDVLGMAEYEREQAENLLALRAAAELQPISWVAYDRARWQFSSQLASSGGPWARYVFLTHGEERFIDWDARMEHGADKVFSNAMPALVTAGGLGQMAAGAFLLVVPEPTMATKVAGWYNLGAGADLLGGYWLTDDHKGLRQRGLEGLGMSPGWASGTMLAMDLGVNAGAVFAPSLMAREGGAWPSVERVGARRQVQNLRLISAMDANRQFVRKGQFPPFAEGTFIRQFDAATELQFVRVHSALNPRGGWLVRAEEIRGLSPQQIQQRLALPEVPTHIQVVTVPRGTTMQVGRAGAQPQWGIPNKGAFQYRVEGILPEFSFGLSVPIPK